MNVTTTHPTTDTEHETILTSREQEILHELLEGFSSQKIADRLCISRKTVEFHQMNIYRKLRVTSRMQAICKALQLGWVSLDSLNR